MSSKVRVQVAYRWKHVEWLNSVQSMTSKRSTYIYTFSLSRSIIKHSKKSSSRERSHVMRGSLTFRNSRSGSNSVSWLLIPFVRPRSEGATRCYNFHIVPFKVKLHPPGFLVDCLFTFSFFRPIFFLVYPSSCLLLGWGFFFSGTLFVFSHLLKRGREVLDSHIWS